MIKIAKLASMAACAAWLGACSTEPPRPAALTIVSGDSQSGLAGTALAESLVVAVSDAGGTGIEGVNVTWHTSSGGSVTPATSLSSSAGHAASAVVLAGAGTGGISATVDGLAPVVFTTISIAPCDWRVPFTLAGIVSGALSASDCQYSDGSFIDYYRVTAATQQAVRIRLISSDFDAFLFFDTDLGVPVAGNDDDATTTNSEILVILAPGSYVIGANSYDPAVTGAYVLTTLGIPETIAACAIWFTTPAVSTSQQLAATDCQSAGFYADLAAVWLEGGRAYTFTQTSAAFDAYLELLDGGGGLVAGDDNSAGGTNASITYMPGASGLYILAPQSAVAGATGAYTLSISAPTPAPPVRPTVSAARARQRGTVWPVGGMRRPLVQHLK